MRRSFRPFKTGEAFIPETGGLRQLAVRGAGITIFTGGVGLAIQVVATVVLARLLAPRDFGLVAMVTTFSLLLANFGLNGLTEAVVQREEVNHVLASTLFWLNVSAGLLLTIGLAAAGSLLARFYHDARVQLVAIAISPTIVITSASVLHLALLKRAMRFSQVSANDIIARATSTAVSITLGWAGFGYWSLIAGAITLPLSTSVGAWFLCRWVPGFPRRVEGTTSVVEFALQTYGRFSIGYLSRNTDNLLVGWRFSAQSLGFYKKAYDLFALSASQLVASITVVAVSALSRTRHDTLQYQRYLLNAMTFMAFVGMGLAADVTLVGKDLIRLLLGPGWEPAGHIFMFFGPGIGIMMLYYTHAWVHLSIGRADRGFRWGIVEFAVTFLLFIAGLPWGPVGIAVAWTVSFWILFVPAMWYAGKPIGLEVRPVLSAVWKYIVASLAAGSVTAVLIRQTTVLTDIPHAVGACIRIIVVSLLFIALYLGVVILLHGGLKPLYQISALSRDMMPWNRLSWAPPVLAPGNNRPFAVREE